jgi:predicted ribosomally synthesized peptide with nif11-like leader
MEDFNMAGIKEFKEKILTDKAFAEKFKDAGTPGDVIALAAKNGFTFTADDIENDTELTDAELSAVAGGSVDVSIFFKTKAVGRFVIVTDV